MALFDKKKSIEVPSGGLFALELRFFLAGVTVITSVECTVYLSNSLGLANWCKQSSDLVLTREAKAQLITLSHPLLSMV